MLEISVTRVTTLIGQNTFCSPEYGWRGMTRNVPRNQKVMAAEDWLRSRDLFETYCNTQPMTSTLNTKARKLTQQAAKQHKCHPKAVRWFFAKERGKTQEPTLLDRYDAIRRQEIIETSRCTDDGNLFRLHGKIDGVANDCVVEAKVRCGQFYDFRDCEITQLALYCLILSKPGRLICQADKDYVFEMSLESAAYYGGKALKKLGTFVDLKIKQQSLRASA